MRYPRPRRAAMRALLVTLACLAAPSAAPRAETPGDAAVRLGTEARRQFAERRYEECAATFMHLWSVAPVPAVLYNAGRCFERAGRAPEALYAYEEFLQRDAGSPYAGAATDAARSLRSQVGTTHGRLCVETTPPGASLAVDGSMLATTPACRWVREGERAVEVMLDEHVPLTLSVPLVAGGERVLDLRMVRSDAPGTVHVQADVPGAVMKVDGVVVGPLPAASPLVLAPGPHTLDVMLDDGRFVTMALDVTPASESTVNAKLGTAQVEPAAPGSPAEEPSASDPIPAAAWVTGATAIAAVGTAIALHVLAFRHAEDTRAYGEEPGADPARWRELGERAERELIGAQVSWGLAGAAALATALVVGLAGGEGGGDPGVPTTGRALAPIVWSTF